MTPTKALFERMLVLLGGDTTTLNQGGDDEITIRLAKEPFTPSANLVIGDLTEATFTGYGARLVAEGAQPQSNDPATADSLLTFNPSSSSYNWEVTGGTGLPQTIHGYYLCSHSAETLFASALLDTPVTLTAINDFVSIPLPQLRQLAGTVI